MRKKRSLRLQGALIACCAVLLAGCGASAPLAAHPAGWQSRGAAPDVVWVDPAHPRSQFTVRQTSYSGSLKSLSSQAAVDAIISHPGTRLERSVPFAACPGEAGVQTYALKAEHGTAELLDVGFSVRDGTSVVVHYRRPVATKANPAVVDAMKAALCFT